MNGSSALACTFRLFGPCEKDRFYIERTLLVLFTGREDLLSRGALSVDMIAVTGIFFVSSAVGAVVCAIKFSLLDPDRARCLSKAAIMGCQKPSGWGHVSSMVRSGADDVLL